MTATLPVLLLDSTYWSYYSTGCATELCPCRVQPPHACRTAFPFVCTYSRLSCIAVWARRCHSGFMQHCCFAQAIAPCPDDFAGPCRDTCIRTRRHCACDHLTCERVMGPRCPRSSMVVKPFSFYVVIRDVVASVRCALQEFIVFLGEIVE